jgi:hypothetical protein
MKQGAKFNRREGVARASFAEGAPPWKGVGEIPGFPFEKFDEMQAAIAARSFNIGVDPFAAAGWADRFAPPLKKAVVGALSILLLVAAIAAVVVALVTGNYWLMLAPPIQAVVFYISHPASPLGRWATVVGVLTLPLFINLLLNQMPTAATLAVYAGLTFAAVRAAAHITGGAFRKALVADEALFVAAYADRACTLRNNRTKRVFKA